MRHVVAPQQILNGGGKAYIPGLSGKRYFIEVEVRTYFQCLVNVGDMVKTPHFHVNLGFFNIENETFFVYTNLVKYQG